MTDITKTIAEAREALAKYGKNNPRLDTAMGCAVKLRDLLAALDAAQPVAWYRPSEEGYDSAFRDAATVARCDGHDWAGWVPLYLAPQAPPAAVPTEGFRDSALNSARFRARCYALVGIVEGIAGLGRRWASDGERLKDTPEWVAFYNSVSAMRNGTTEAPPAAMPTNVRERWNIERDGEECEYVRYVPEASPAAVPVRGADGGFGWIGSSHGVMTARDAPQAPPAAVPVTDAMVERAEGAGL